MCIRDRIPSMQPAGRSSIRQDQVGTAGRSSVRQDQLRILEEGLLHAIRDERLRERRVAKILLQMDEQGYWKGLGFESAGHYAVCLLYTSDAADERSSV